MSTTPEVMKDHNGNVFIREQNNIVTVTPWLLADLASLLLAPSEIGYHWAPISVQPCVICDQPLTVDNVAGRLTHVVCPTPEVAK